MRNLTAGRLIIHKQLSQATTSKAMHSMPSERGIGKLPHEPRAIQQRGLLIAVWVGVLEA